jgi:hypothetical protein
VVCEQLAYGFLTVSRYRRKGTKSCVNVAALEGLWKLRFMYASLAHIHDPNQGSLLPLNCYLTIDNKSLLSIFRESVSKRLKASHISANSKEPFLLCCVKMASFPFPLTVSPYWQKGRSQCGKPVLVASVVAWSCLWKERRPVEVEIYICLPISDS